MTTTTSAAHSAFCSQFGIAERGPQAIIDRTTLVQISDEMDRLREQIADQKRTRAGDQEFHKEMLMEVSKLAVQKFAEYRIEQLFKKGLVEAITEAAQIAEAARKPAEEMHDVLTSETVINAQLDAGVRSQAKARAAHRPESVLGPGKRIPDAHPDLIESGAPKRRFNRVGGGNA